MKDNLSKLLLLGSIKLIQMFYLVITCVEVSLRFLWLEFNSSIFLTGVELEDWRNPNSQRENWIKEDTVVAPGFQEWSVVVDF